ncbi:MAG: ATP-binding protein [Paracoccaceae bacterium]|nr:ATP-binding protein [Paracoccaceae bacterium]
MRKVIHQQKIRRDRIAYKRKIRRNRKTRKSEVWRFDQKQRYFSFVEMWDGVDFVKACCIRRPKLAPSVMCLERNRDETLKFINDMRQRMYDLFLAGGNDYVRARPGKLPIIYGYIDFSKVEVLSTATAVILAAEYDRVKERMKKVPPTINLYEWSQAAFLPLFGVGFFDVVGISDDMGEKVISSPITKTMKLVPMGLEDNKLREVDSHISELYEFIHPGSAVPDAITTNILTSVSEAISNVVDHAYADRDYEYRVPPIDRLWVTASARKDNQSITVVVYDQGAGIPHTYPKRTLGAKISSFIREYSGMPGGSLNGHVEDDAYIRAAMKFGSSRTNLPHRGKGLPEMSRLVSSFRSGKMSVYSGRGWWQQTGDGRPESGLALSPVGGTLIEWTLQLPGVNAHVL